MGRKVAPLLPLSLSHLVAVVVVVVRNSSPESLGFLAPPSPPPSQHAPHHTTLHSTKTHTVEHHVSEERASERARGQMGKGTADVRCGLTVLLAHQPGEGMTQRDRNSPRPSGGRWGGSGRVGSFRDRETPPIPKRHRSLSMRSTGRADRGTGPAVRSIPPSLPPPTVLALQQSLQFF